MFLQLFEGNSDSFSVQHLYVDEPFIARYVKFHTASWSRHPSMRVEVIGCQGSLQSVIIIIIIIITTIVLSVFQTPDRLLL